jgi:glycosyltransferase involved in cell wall biosynthesis
VRIAQVSPLHESVPPALYGGTERVVANLTEELVRAGHEVTLFASGDSRTRARLVAPCRHALRLSNAWSDPTVPHLLMLEQVFARADAGEFDIIHFHTDVLHFPLSRRAGVPAVATMHGRLDLPDYRPLLSEYMELPLVSISDSQRGPVPEANWKATVHHGLPRGLLRPGSGRGGYLAFAGRMSPEKGPDRAIEIARRAGMRLRMAAKVDAKDREYFERVVRPIIRPPGVEFIGEISDAQKSDFFGEAEAVLFPIDWPEPFGIVMIEAIACGTPVIAFRRGSVPEIVHHGETGLIVGGIDEAVHAVRDARRLSRRRCREVFEARFTSERMAADYLRVYGEVIADRVRPPRAAWRGASG